MAGSEPAMVSIRNTLSLSKAEGRFAANNATPGDSAAAAR
jgi:hypothetical protein